jgi:hypothetical protein
MTKLLIYRTIWLGFLSWLIPFIISFFCYNANGELLIDYRTFKSLMVIVGTFSGSYFLFLYFKVVNSDFVLNGIIVGFSWFAINILFDSIVLIPMMKVSFLTYFYSIGIVYISIPAISIAMGYLLDKKANFN